jgi:hypothetical protein
VKDSQAQETRVAGLANGRRVRGSGAKPHARGDARWDEYDILLECKRTDKKSIRITSSMLDKITKEALANGMLPALAFEVQTDFASKDWIALPAKSMERLVKLGYEYAKLLEVMEERDGEVEP